MQNARMAPHTGSSYGSSPPEHPPQTELSSHTAWKGQGKGQEHTAMGHSRARAAEKQAQGYTAWKGQGRGRSTLQGQSSRRQAQGCRTGRGSKGAEVEGNGMHSVLLAQRLRALQGEQSQSWGAAWKERRERGRIRCSSSHSNKSFTAV